MRNNRDWKAKESFVDRSGKFLGYSEDKGTNINIENKVLVLPSELIGKYGITHDSKDSSK